MFTGDIGDNSGACPQIVPLNVYPGATITVTNLTASAGTVSYYNNGLDAGASGTITAGSNQTFTAPAFLTSAGVSSITISGTGY